MTPEQIKWILEHTDWEDYWKRVNERVAREVDAYAEARRKSHQILVGGIVFD